MKVVITDAEYPDIDIERGVLEAVGLEVELAQCGSPEEVIQAGEDASALLVQYAPITSEVFDALPHVRIVSRFGVGVDSIDLESAGERGVWVANVTDYGVEEVATHAMGMILSLVRQLPFYQKEVESGQWRYLSAGPLKRLRNATLGVVGLGRIGQTLAKRGRPWFGQTLGYDPYLEGREWPKGIETTESLEELFSKSQVISLHLPLSEQTRGVVDRGLLEQLQEGSYLVNTSRGGLVVIEDLLRALDSGKLAAAGLDVLPQEPPEPDDPLLAHPRVLLSPHAAWYSAEAEQEVRRKAAENIVSWNEQGRPPYVVVEGKDGGR